MMSDGRAGSAALPSLSRGCDKDWDPLLWSSQSCLEIKSNLYFHSPLIPWLLCYRDHSKKLITAMGWRARGVVLSYVEKNLGDWEKS